jgi:hypothetical protein
MPRSIMLIDVPGSYAKHYFSLNSQEQTQQALSIDPELSRRPAVLPDGGHYATGLQK